MTEINENSSAIAASADERSLTLSLLAAFLSVLSCIMAVFWSVVEMLGGGQLLSQLPAAAALAAATADFALIHILLRNRRPLLLLLIIELLISAVTVCLLHYAYELSDTAKALELSAAWVTAVNVLIGIAILLALLFQLKWEIKPFREEALMLLLQTVLAMGIFMLWISGQLNAATEWTYVLFLDAALLVFARIMAKASGLGAQKSGHKNGFGMRGGLTAGIAAAFALLAAIAVFFTEPLGRALMYVYNKLEFILIGAAELLGRILTFLFSFNRIRSDESVSTSGGSGNMEEYVPTGEHNTDILRIIVTVIFAALILMLVLVLLKLLLQITVGTGIKAVRKRSSMIEQHGSFWEQLKALVKELRQRIHARFLLRRHSNSVAALIVYIEKRTRRSEKLHRRQGESLRSFLLRLADCTEETEEKLAAALRSFADKADSAYYGRNKQLLEDFEEGEKLRSLIKNFNL